MNKYMKIEFATRKEERQLGFYFDPEKAIK